MASSGALLVVVHLWSETDLANVTVRIISARKASEAEQAIYRGHYESRRRYEGGVRFQSSRAGQALCRSRCGLPHSGLSPRGGTGVPARESGERGNTPGPARQRLAEA